MSRPIWKGYISFGLVNIPIILYSAENRSDIHFKLIDSRDKAKIHYIRVNEHTGEEVPWQNIAKGYEYEEGNYILLDDKDLKSMATELSKTIAIENFVNLSEIDYMDFDKPYYVVPDKKGEKGYVILRECLKSTGKVGITKVVIHTRQYVAALMAYKNGLVLNLLRYHQELKKPTEFDLPKDDYKTYKVTPKELEIGKQLVNSMSSQWKPGTYHDEFQDALHHWIDEKIQHKKPRAAKKEMRTTRKGNVVNFAELLKQSLAQKKKAKS